MTKPGFRLKLQPIEISSEEILADLLYPAPSVTLSVPPKRVPHRGERRA